MKVQQLSLSNFAAFDGENTLEFCPGINVLIGANSTGKSLVMKALYSLLKVCERANRDNTQEKDRVVEYTRNKLMGVYKVQKLGHLVRGQKRGQSAKLQMDYAGRVFSVEIYSNNELNVEYKALPIPPRVVFIPSHEFLTLYPGFIHTYTNRETGFDETYYDLALALNGSLLRGSALEEAQAFIAPLEKAINNGTISQEKDEFYFKLPEGRLEAQLVSEGLRKIGQVIYLMQNGSLQQNSILFWDEPEANLNPKMITVVVEVLKALASKGVQIFLATHDYLLSQELSLLAEYSDQTRPSFDIRFLGFSKSGRKGVKIDAGASLVEIEDNPILDEFAAHYHREQALFSQDARSVKE